MFLFNRNTGFENLDVPTYHSDYQTPAAPHVLVDVRTPGEYQSGHLPGAVNIPLNELDRRLSEIPKGQPVVVVCATGNRSQTGSSILVRGGCTEVYNLRGGTMAWMMRGLPLES
ncbi:MAG: rhodanese-like domain-containing protein [Anaerolineae bacterium]|nr:rhodanese-like domain-containing protein [Anaerolineae bacterium]